MRAPGLIDPDLPPLPIFPTCGPRHRYGAVLFLEKRALVICCAPPHRERYDLAIMSTKGLSNTAARRLVDHPAPSSICRCWCSTTSTDRASIVARRARDPEIHLQERSEGDRYRPRLADVDAYDLQTEPSTDVGDGDIDTLR